MKVRVFGDADRMRGLRSVPDDPGVDQLGPVGRHLCLLVQSHAQYRSPAAELEELLKEARNRELDILVRQSGGENFDARVSKCPTKEREVTATHGNGYVHSVNLSTLFIVGI